CGGDGRAIQSRNRSDWHHPDEGRRGCPRRRYSVHQGRHWKAHKIPRHRRKTGRLGAFSPGPHGIAHSRDGGCAVIDREGPRSGGSGPGPGDGPKAPVRWAHAGRFSGTIEAGEQTRVSGPDPGHAAGRPAAQGYGRRGPSRKRTGENGGYYRLDDAQRAAGPYAAQRQSQETHRQGQRDQRTGCQSAHQAIPRGAKNDESIIGPRGTEVVRQTESRALILTDAYISTREERRQTWYDLD